MSRNTQRRRGPVKRSWLAALLAIVVMAAAGGTRVSVAQNTGGRFAGVLKDPTGRRIPLASLALIEVGTDRKIAQQSTESGQFVFSNLAAGTYRSKSPGPGSCGIWASSRWPRGSGSNGPSRRTWGRLPRSSGSGWSGHEPGKAPARRPRRPGRPVRAAGPRRLLVSAGQARECVPGLSRGASATRRLRSGASHRPRGHERSTRGAAAGGRVGPRVHPGRARRAACVAVHPGATRGCPGHVPHRADPSVPG